MSDFGPKYYDRRGKPLGLFEWAAKFEDDDYRRVADDVVKAGRRKIRVSTIWLGLDHDILQVSSDKPGPRQIFETATITPASRKPGGRGNIEIIERYPTLVQAIAGHNALVAKLKQKVKPSNSDE